MRYSITHRGANVEIRIKQTGDHAQQLLASLQECQEGRCACPTDQYDRLADMTIQVAADQVDIQLRPREGDQLDTDQLQVCLDHTIAKTQNRNG
jgi:hypothetical protein